MTKFPGSWRRTLPFLMALSLAPVLLSSAARATTGEEGYVQSAQQLVAKGDFKGAVIELRNAARAAPNSAAVHLLLAQVYLKLDNIPAAEGEARAALQNGASEAKVAPTLAEALLRGAKYDQLLREIPVGDRPAAAESAVRLFRAHAYLSMNRPQDAAPLMQQAERLDPNAVGPKLGMARLLMAQNDTAGAEKEVDAALAISPTDSRGEIAKAEILREQGDIDHALAYFNDVIQREPQNSTARVGRANLHIAKNELDPAEQDLQAVLANQPSNFEAIYLQALIDARRNKLAESNGLLDKISARFDFFPAGYLLQGSVQFLLGHPSEAEADLDKFAARSPNNPVALKVLAEITLRHGGTAKATGYLETLTKLTPNDAAAWVMLADAYLAAGDTAQASQALDRANTLASSNLQLQTDMAVTRLSTGQQNQGLQQLEQVFGENGGVQVAGPSLILAALHAHQVDKAAAAAEAYDKANPDNLIARNFLGLVRIAQTDLPGAEKIFHDTYAAHPEFAVAGRNLAAVYLAEGRPDDAAATFRAMIQRDPRDVDSMMALANIDVSRRDISGAIAELKQAVNAAPDIVPPSLRLAALYGSQKDWADALDLMRGISARSPNNVDVLDTLARVQAGSGDIAGAVTSYRHAIATGTKSPIVYERFAQVLVQAKDLNGARTALRQAVALDPKNAAYRGALVELEYKIAGTEAAMTVAKSLASGDDADSVATQWVATALARAGKLSEALTLIAEAQKTRPSTPLTFQHALLLAANGQQAKGIAELKAWVAAHPDDGTARRNLADVELSSKDYADAQTQYEHLAALDPKDMALLNNLAWVYEAQGNPKAEATARRAYALAPLAPSVADTLGWIMVNAGDAKGGLPYLQAASYGLPQDPNVQYHLAVALSKTGKTHDARDMLAKLVGDSSPFDSKPQASQLLHSLDGKTN